MTDMNNAPADVYGVSCPNCDAAPGHRCRRTPRGYSVSTVTNEPCRARTNKFLKARGFFTRGAAVNEKPGGG